ncbi:MAG: hypothetical protein LUH05_04935 [Candidatus Gastranaerophilales bacterium]|nr:hypothetical protein [Candidatus Gastranaerophilales bacterium]
MNRINNCIPINYVPKDRKRVTIKIKVQNQQGEVHTEEVTGKRVNIDGIETFVHKSKDRNGYIVTDFRTGYRLTSIDSLSDLDNLSFKNAINEYNKQTAGIPTLNAEER